jgi:hypothetical protein
MAAVGERQPAPAPALAELCELADLVTPLALRAVCDLRIADHLRDGPLHVEALARRAGADPGALRRVLRALAGRGVFAEREPGVFELTAVAEFLRGDHPLSLRDGLSLIAPDLAAWAHADYSLRTGRSAFEHVHGRPYYDALARDDDFRMRFDRSVETQNRVMLRPLVTAYDWSGCGTVVDLAGGTGVFLAGLLARHRALEGILFDLPHVVSQAPPVLRAARVEGRCRIVAGDLFEAVPEAGDTYVLKTVLHDWDDDRARRILDVVVAAMRPDSRLVVLEALLPEGDAFHLGKLLDVNSLVLVAGPDRDEDALVALLRRAGLACSRVVRTTTLAVLEARPA